MNRIVGKSSITPKTMILLPVYFWMRQSRLLVICHHVQRRFPSDLSKLERASATVHVSRGLNLAYPSLARFVPRCGRCQTDLFLSNTGLLLF